MKYIVATIMSLFTAVAFAAQPAKKEEPKAATPAKKEETKKEVKKEEKKEVKK